MKFQEGKTDKQGARGAATARDSATYAEERASTDSSKTAKSEVDSGARDDPQKKRKKWIIGLLAGAAVVTVLVIAFGGGSGSAGNGLLSRPFDVADNVVDGLREASQAAFSQELDPQTGEIASRMADSIDKSAEAELAQRDYDVKLITSQGDSFYAASSEARDAILNSVDLAARDVLQDNEASIAAYNSRLAEIIKTTKMSTDNMARYVDSLQSEAARKAAMEGILADAISAAVASISSGEKIAMVAEYNKSYVAFVDSLAQTEAAIAAAEVETLASLHMNAASGPQIICAQLADVRVNDVVSSSYYNDTSYAWSVQTKSKAASGGVSILGASIGGGKKTSTTTATFTDTHRTGGSNLADHSMSFTTQVVPYGNDFGSGAIALWNATQERLLYAHRAKMLTLESYAPSMQAFMQWLVADPDEIKAISKLRRSLYAKVLDTN